LPFLIQKEKETQLAKKWTAPGRAFSLPQNIYYTHPFI